MLQSHPVLLAASEPVAVGPKAVRQRLMELHDQVNLELLNSSLENTKSHHRPAPAAVQLQAKLAGTAARASPLSLCIVDTPGQREATEEACRCFKMLI